MNRLFNESCDRIKWRIAPGVKLWATLRRHIRKHLEHRSPGFYSWQRLSSSVRQGLKTKRDYGDEEGSMFIPGPGPIADAVPYLKGEVPAEPQLIVAIVVSQIF